MIIKYPEGKTFSIHLDYMVNEARLVRVSISNIFKEFKVIIVTSYHYLEFKW